MTNVKVGSIVKGTGLGELFTQIAGGSSRGVVVHVGGQPIVNEKVQDEFDRGLFDEQFIEEPGVLYMDEGNGEILWLAPNDYVVLEGGLQ